ncbi:MAG: FliM/FliN family flagellar motor switch protein [Planctomycetota bacterium]
MATDLQTLLNLNVPLIVQIGRRTASVDDILSFGPGAIFELDKVSDEPLDVLVNNKHVGTGSAVKVGENFGIRFDEIGPPEERLNAALG